MGLLQEGTIPTIFQGVSRQPDSIRFPGQVEDALNVSFSVETGGFSKRNGTSIVSVLSSTTESSSYRLHLVRRSATEEYAFVHNETSGLTIVDLSDGSKPSLTIPAEDASFFQTASENLEFLSVIDYTFVVDKSQVVALAEAPITESVPQVAIQLTKANTDGEYKVTVKYDDTSFDGVFTAADTDPEPDDVIPSIHTSLTANASGTGWVFEKSGSYLYIKNTNGTSFSVETFDPHGDAAFTTTGNRVADTEDLVAKAWNNQMVEVRKSTEEEGFWLKFVADGGEEFGSGTWDETVPPGTKVDFDPATMPRAVVRKEDGTFELQRIDWDTKKAGGDILVPPPEFVGSSISDLVFRANRLGILSGENTFYSGAGDYFRFWPESATQLLPTDPFGLTNSTNFVSKFTFGVPFRRSLFIMSDEAQFEAFGTPFSSETAQLEVATQYPAKASIRPVVIGDELYFISETGNEAMLFSYVYNEETVSETANEVSRHVRGFLKGPIGQIASVPLNNEVHLLPEDNSGFYSYRYYYEGKDRVQSAWGRNEISTSKVLAVNGMGDELFMLVSHDNGYLMLEKLASIDKSTDEFEHMPRMDHQQWSTGVYDSETNRTTWTLQYPFTTHPVALTTNLFPFGKQFIEIGIQVSGNTATAVGDFSSHPVLFGQPYDSEVILSKQYIRQNNESLVTGRLQLRKMNLRYTDTGAFTVEVTPEFRDTKSYVFNGRTLGSGQNVIQATPIVSGRLSFLVGSNAETVTIKIKSGSFLPFTITSGAWTGFFNEISRQDYG